MAVKYDYDPELNAVIIHLNGRVNKSEVIECLDDISADSAVRPGHFQIVDLSTTEDYAVTEEDLAEIALKGQEVATSKGHQRSYYFADSTRAYSIAKTLQALGDDHGFNIEIYRDWEAMVHSMGVRARGEP